MSLLIGDLIRAEGFPGVAVVLGADEVAWHSFDGIRSGTLADFLEGRAFRTLRLVEPLKRHASGAFPPSVDPRHTSIAERELVAYLLAGQVAERDEVEPWILKAARAQLGHDFLLPESDASQREAAAVLFALNCLQVVECCHGVVPHAGLCLADLDAGNFVTLAG